MTLPLSPAVSAGPEGDGTHRSSPAVILVSMPFMSLDLTPLSVGILKAALTRADIRCDTAFHGFDLADVIGVHNYRKLMIEGALTGEWVFVEALYGEPLVEDELARYEEINRHWHTWDDTTRFALGQFRSAANQLIDWCLEAHDWSQYDLVGFTSTFHQNLASLALGRRIKERHPEVKVAYGGSNCQSTLGESLHEQFGFIDYVATGEGDAIIADLARAAAGEIAPATIPGIAYRDHLDGPSLLTDAQPLNEDLDSLPIPDYHDWFAERARHPAVVRELEPNIVYESSRGCWWGMRRHCTFCGLNANAMASRVKSAERVLDELTTLRERHGVNTFMAADTIIPMSYFNDLLPQLAALEPKLDIFYETKVNLSPGKVRLLAEAGISSIQPGIEHLSDNVLELIRKGTTGIQNVQFLRWCEEFGIDVDWLFLVGIPGETRPDYDDVAAIAERCHHLIAPASVQRVVIHRFSPFHETPEELGFTNVRPDPAYAFLYRADDDQLARLAYLFTADRVDGTTMPPLGRAAEAIADWQQADRRAGLWVRRLSGDEVEIIDERGDEPAVTSLQGWRAQLYEACDQIRSRRRLEKLLPDVAESDLEAGLADLVAQGLVLESRGRYLSLAVYRPARQDFPNERRRLMVVGQGGDAGATG